MKPTLSDKNTRMNIVISKELKDKLKEQANKEHRSFSNMIVIAIEEYLKKEGS